MTSGARSEAEPTPPPPTVQNLDAPLTRTTQQNSIPSNYQLL